MHNVKVSDFNGNLIPITSDPVAPSLSEHRGRTKTLQKLQLNLTTLGVSVLGQLSLNKLLKSVKPDNYHLLVIIITS